MCNISGPNLQLSRPSGSTTPTLLAGPAGLFPGRTGTNVAEAGTRPSGAKGNTEEIYLYPATRAVLPDGDEIADREIDDHSEAEHTMKRLVSLPPDDPQFDAEVRVLTTSVREHITDEEENLFPRLREACSREQLVELGQKVERAKQVAPTSPSEVR
jgi:hypothetical protein